MKQHVMITLDSLLDTRLACLAEYNPKQAAHVLSNGWSKRKTLFGDDIIRDLDLEKVKAIWKNRNIETLKNSVCTNWAESTNTLVSLIAQEMGINPRISDLCVEINFHPYNLSKEEQDAFCDALASCISQVVPVKGVVIPDVYIDHFLIKNNYAAIIHHDWDAYSTAQEHNLIKFNFPETKMFFPKCCMYNGAIQDWDMTFEAISAPLAHVVGLEFENIETYSIDYRLI